MNDFTAKLVRRSQPRYNSGMKTAVSIPDPVFRAGERLAKHLRIPRSRLYALALAEYVERQSDAEITRRMDAALAAHPLAADPFVREAARRTVRKSAW